jgi:LacI family transcriptional regulator
MRPTLADIAVAAQVSHATVDRVMNDRPGVSARTRAQVLAAARRLGYLAEGPEAPGAPITLRLLLPTGTNAYIAELSRSALRQAAGTPGLMVEVTRTPALDSDALAAALLRSTDVDGVAVVALNHPAIREAIRRLSEQGVPVVTLASDLPDTPRLAYVGIDNGQAGRLAGYALARFLGPHPRGKVALFAGTLGYRGHQEREMGFRQVLAEDFPDLTLLELRESREDRQKALHQTRDLLAAHPDLVGVYNAGGATVGITAALQEAGRAHDVVFIAHEATAENKAALLSGTLDGVIDQSARDEIRETLAALMAAVRGVDRVTYPPRLQLILRENLPSG